MRRKLAEQLGLVTATTDHVRARELDVMSRVLDELPGGVDLVYRDLLSASGKPDTGREAMTAEQVLRAMVIKQRFGCSYDALAFQLADSSDCTVVETNIHEPSDSSLLWDCVRVLVRLMTRAKETFGTSFSSRRRRAKRRAIGILNAKSKEQRTALYRDLLKVTEDTMAQAEHVRELLENAPVSDFKQALLAQAIEQEMTVVLALAVRVVDQTERRVLRGESVPATEKVVSIFEPHTDIIIKDRRETFYGHKICLTSGASGLVLDLVIEKGNPADSTLAQKMVERVRSVLGKLPNQVTFDGGFSSKVNVKDIKAMGVGDVAFSKHVGLEITDMAKSKWVFRKLQNFRAGIEATISFLKRTFGLSRCNWSGFDSFSAYAWSSVLSCNLLVLARQLLE